MSHSGVNLYAEFLLNISQVTIFATLDLKGGDDETAHLSSDRQRIEITYGGESAAITYPNGISGTAIVHLPIKAAAHVSLRLEITEKGDPYWKNSLETLNDSPWTAHAFSSDTTVACRWCKAVVCDPSRIQRWKDLPRSDWAETMDMWHCHKPEVPGESHAHDGHKHPDKNGFVQLRQGTAFIDSSDLVVVPTDTDLQPAQGQETGAPLVNCQSCQKSIGRNSDDPVGAYRLHKWNLAVKRHVNTDWETNDIQSLLCTQLLELADSQASKRFLLRGSGGEDQVKSLMLWVLNPDLKYCASYVGAGHPRRAMKILYKDFDDCQAQDSKQHDSSLELPGEVVGQIRDTLAESNKMMPPAARSVQGWTAGLLDRFNPVHHAQERDRDALFEAETDIVSVQ